VADWVLISCPFLLANGYKDFYPERGRALRQRSEREPEANSGNTVDLVEARST
jgi:hypothetical protein